jgi:hypothetical protein
MNRFRIGALAAGAVALLATLGMPGTALAAATSGHEHFTIVLPQQSSGSVDATGAFNARGTDSEVSTSATSGTSTFVFPAGMFKVTHTDNPGVSQRFNPKTCVASFRGSGDYTIIKDNRTGAFVGITGHGEYNVHGKLGFAHTPTGCGNNPISGVTIIEAGGPLSFG